MQCQFLPEDRICRISDTVNDDDDDGDDDDMGFKVDRHLMHIELP